jgi:hypothetical protein
MKTVTIALEDDLYETARAEAVKHSKSLGEYLHDVFWSGLRSSSNRTGYDKADTLAALWSLADSQYETPGSAGPLNRDSLYERGLSGH